MKLPVIKKLSIRAAAGAVAALVLCLLPGCRYGPVPIQDVKTSRTLTPFSFIEEGRLVVLIVGVEAARHREDAEFVPLVVAVGNKRVRPALRLSRESFYLVDSEGNRIEMASYEEILARYPSMEMDRRLLGDRGFIPSKFDVYMRIPAKFFPIPGRIGVVQDRVEIPTLGYMENLLYFPMPAGGLKGRHFDLFLDCPPLEDPIFVTFEIR